MYINQYDVLRYYSLDLMTDKRALRKLVKLRLLPSPTDFGHLESQSKILVEKMRSRNEWINAKKIAMYLPLKDEPNIDRLICEGKSAGKVIGVPVYSKFRDKFRNLKFFRFQTF